MQNNIALDLSEISDEEKEKIAKETKQMALEAEEAIKKYDEYLKTL